MYQLILRFITRGFHEQVYLLVILDMKKSLGAFSIFAECFNKMLDPVCDLHKEFVHLLIQALLDQSLGTTMLNRSLDLLP